MKSRPILFSAAMVRALIDGSKTQTRRVVKAEWQGLPLENPDYQREALGKNPYGQPGDQLWVREEHYQFGHWEPVEGKLTKGGRQKWQFVPDDSNVLFEVFTDYRKGRHSADPAMPAWHKRLARFMPRKYSRITLEILSVRVERLQEISDADAIAEGIIEDPDCIVGANCAGGVHQEISGTLYFRDRNDDEGHEGPVEAYRQLWEMINGPGSWQANPWVWVVEFKRMEVKP